MEILGKKKLGVLIDFGLKGSYCVMIEFIKLFLKLSFYLVEIFEIDESHSLFRDWAKEILYNSSVLNFYYFLLYIFTPSLNDNYSSLWGLSSTIRIASSYFYKFWFVSSSLFSIILRFISYSFKRDLLLWGLISDLDLRSCSSI